MTDQQKPRDDERRADAFLDDLLTDAEKEQLLRESDSPEELLAARELQQRIDESLRRSFRFDEPTERELAVVATKVDSVRARRTRFLARRKNLVGLAVAASLFLIAGIGFWQFGRDDRSPPSFRARPLVAIYQETVDHGFEPYYDCSDPKRFAKEFEMRQGQRLRLAPLPAGSQMLGISYLGGLSRMTTAMLCIVEQQKLIVFVERAEHDRPEFAAENKSTDLNVFSEKKNGLVFYEVSPLDQPRMIEHFEFLD